MFRPPSDNLHESMFEDPQLDLPDQSRSFCQWDEHIRRDIALSAGIPTDQCFDGREFKGIQAVDRLIHQVEFILLDGFA